MEVWERQTGLHGKKCRALIQGKRIGKSEFKSKTVKESKVNELSLKRAEKMKLDPGMQSIVAEKN